MRILLIHQAFATGNEPGGTRHLEFGHYLALAGDSMTIVASQVSYATGKPTNPARSGLWYEERVDGVRVFRAYIPAVVHRSYPWRVFAFFIFSATSTWAGMRAGPVDVVLGTSPPIFQAVSAWLVAHLRRKPFVLEVRDLWPEFAIEMGVLHTPVLIAMSRWLERFLYRHADHLIVNSPAYVDYLVAKGVANAKVQLIPNGVDVNMFNPSARGTAFRDRFAPGDKVLVIYAGAHGAANDIDTILDAAERLKEIDKLRFVFVGDGKERPRLEAEAANRHLHNVVFTGAVPKAQMPDVLAAADICIATLKDIPMFTTTYPNKVFDYMAAGRPTVLAIGGVIRKVIEDSGGGIFVPPGDSGALAEAITRLAGSPETRFIMGANARSFVVKHYARQHQSKEFRNVMIQFSFRASP